MPEVGDVEALGARVCQFFSSSHVLSSLSYYLNLKNIKDKMSISLSIHKAKVSYSKMILLILHTFNTIGAWLFYAYLDFKQCMLV